MTIALRLPCIEPIPQDDSLSRDIDAELDAKTKPPGSLGELERLAAKIARVQRRVAPRIEHARVFVFAADHGITTEGVSAYPSTVTAQMVHNFLGGGAAICVLARELGAGFTVVDAGVATVLPEHDALLDRKIGFGTSNFAHTPAMTLAQCVQALQAGIDITADLPAHGAVVLGEMGIGNSTSAATLMHALTGLPVDDCVGRGTGVDDLTLQRKRDTVESAVRRQGRGDNALQTLRCFGGFEIAMMAGAVLGAAAARQVVLVDGFIATAAVAVAAQLQPEALDYCVFAHVSAELPHRAWLKRLDARPLLDLGLRLGEGSGAILALPLVRSACAILSDMATFRSAGVSGRV